MVERYSVLISKSIRKSLLRIPSPWVDRMRRAIDALQENPYLGEKMKGEHKDKWRIKIWPYRIMYKIDKKSRVIIIVEIDHRGHMSYD